MTQAILFERQQVAELEDLADRPRRLTGSKLLWVDLDGGSEAGADEVAEAFGLDDETRDGLAKRRDQPVCVAILAVWRIAQPT